MAYIRAAELGMEIGQSNAAWMLSRGYGAQGPAAATLAMKLHQRAAGQVCTCLHMLCAHAPPHLHVAWHRLPKAMLRPSRQLGTPCSDKERKAAALAGRGVRQSLLTRY